MSLNHREQLFILEYLKDLNGTQAAIRAGYTPSNARKAAYKLLQKPEIQEAIAAAFAERVKRVRIEGDAVLREVYNIAMADANELVEYRRNCCRHCWGVDFKYQRTAGELANDMHEHQRNGGSSLAAEFDNKGGAGFDATREPNDDCPECVGEGVGEVFVKDTRLLLFGARSLYAGVKRTRDGIEVKMHDKGKMLELLMRHLGLLNDKLDVNVNSLAERLIAGRKRVGG